jgi:hypothetical protein
MNYCRPENIQYDSHFHVSISGSVIATRIVRIFMKLKASEIWGVGNKIYPLYWSTIWDEKIQVRDDFMVALTVSGERKSGPYA